MAVERQEFVFYDGVKFKETLVKEIDALPVRDKESVLNSIYDTLSTTCRFVNKNKGTNEVVEAMYSTIGWGMLGAHSHGIYAKDSAELIGLLMKLGVMKDYENANFRDEKSRFNMAVEYMTKALKGITLVWGATDTPSKLYKKSSESERTMFKPCKDFGPFHIEGVRFGPRDGIILELRGGVYRYELAARRVPPNCSYRLDGKKIEVPHRQECPVFNAMIEGLCVKSGANINRGVEVIRSYIKLRKEDGAIKEAIKAKTAELKNEIPNFGMWG